MPRLVYVGPGAPPEAKRPAVRKTKVRVRRRRFLDDGGFSELSGESLRALERRDRLSRSRHGGGSAYGGDRTPFEDEEEGGGSGGSGSKAGRGSKASKKSKKGGSDSEGSDDGSEKSGFVKKAIGAGLAAAAIGTAAKQVTKAMSGRRKSQDGSSASRGSRRSKGSRRSRTGGRSRRSRGSSEGGGASDDGKGGGGRFGLGRFFGGGGGGGGGGGRGRGPRGVEVDGVPYGDFDPAGRRRGDRGGRHGGGLHPAGPFDPDFNDREHNEYVKAAAKRSFGYWAVPESHAFVVEKDGRFLRILPPGKHHLGFGEEIAHVHSLSVKSLRFDQPFLTYDREEVGVVVHLLVKVDNPVQASYMADDPLKNLMLITIDALRSQMARMPVERCFDEAEAIGFQTRMAVNQQARAWGWVCLRVMLDINPSMDIRRQMEVRAQQVREGIIQVEGRRRQANAQRIEQDMEIERFQRNRYAEELDRIHRSQAEAESAVARASADARVIQQYVDILDSPKGEQAIEYALAAKMMNEGRRPGGGIHVDDLAHVREMSMRGMPPPGMPPPGMHPNMHAEMHAGMHPAGSGHSGMPPVPPGMSSRAAMSMRGAIPPGASGRMMSDRMRSERMMSERMMSEGMMPDQMMPEDMIPEQMMSMRGGVPPPHPMQGHPDNPHPMGMGAFGGGGQP